MANQISAQVLEDGHRNAIVQLVGYLDTTDEAYTVKINPNTLGPVDVNPQRKAKWLRIDEIQYSISDKFRVFLFWDAANAADRQTIEVLTGRGRILLKDVGGKQNPRTGTASGAIALQTLSDTSPPTGAAPSSYTLLFWLVKQS
jgi:hypothetical protein